MKALPDLQIEIQRRHVTDDAIILEVMIRGTQLGAWRGLPATGRRVELPLCGIYTFDGDNRLAGEKIYYDRGTVLRQTRRLPRTAERIRTNRHSADASDYDCAGVGAEASGEVIYSSSWPPSVDGNVRDVWVPSAYLGHRPQMKVL
jgi:hypothetical protein